MPPFQLFRIIKKMSIKTDVYHKTYIEVDLNAIVSNLKAIKAKVGTDTKVLFVVKADGYGHGAVQISRAAQEAGVADILGVSSPAEGIELREAGIDLPILILGLILSERDEIEAVLDYDLAQTVADLELAQIIAKYAKDKRKYARLHLKVDTGMGRIGCEPDNAADIAYSINSLDHVELEGIFSHFPESDNPDSEMTKNQINSFNNILNQVKALDIKYKHLANSAAILNFDSSYYNIVRPGLMAYGYYPSACCSHEINLVRSMTMKSCILFFKRVKKGTAISYGLTYTAGKDTNIATVPVGYGDGYSRFLSNKASVIIAGKQYRVAGRVCMDQIMIDCGDDEFKPGEEVILFGKEGITVETISEWIGNIPYEVTCAISKRVPRFYIE
jgi:alanine racemase